MRNVSKNVLYVLFVFSAVACFASEEVETAFCGTENSFDIHEQLVFLKAEDALIDCLFDNRDSLRRESSGLPKECAELARAFIIAGVVKRLEDMIDATNKYRQ